MDEWLINRLRDNGLMRDCHCDHCQNSELIEDLLKTLREAVDYVGAGELKRDDLWHQMLAWHRKVCPMVGVENAYEPE